MAPSPDELAGAADLFGGLTRDELRGCFEDLAAREGWTLDDGAFEAAIDEALDGLFLVGVEHEGTELLAPGPAALPALPAGGEDLPHLLDAEPRSIDRAALETAVERCIRHEAAAAIDDADPDAAARLLDTCFDAEAWGGLELGDVRSALAGIAE